MRTTIIAAAAAAALLAGCAGTEGLRPNHAPRVLPAGSAEGWPDPATGGNAWARWHDGALDALVARALAGQPSLQVAQLRVAQAQAQVAATGAARLPQVNGSVDLSDQRFTKNFIYPAPLGGGIEWSNTANVGASWEWDLFGKTEAALAAAVGQQRAAQAEAQAAGMLLAANVATGWVNLARALELRAVTVAALDERQQVLDIVRQRVGSGLDTTVDLRQAEGAVAQTRLDIAAADEQIARLRHALAELSGQAPDALDSAAPALAPLASQTLPATLPADLIGRRADVVAQRWRVEAALKDVDVARAQFYPNINLTAFVGLQSLSLQRFAEAGSVTYGVGPALRLPIFEGGRLRANLAGRAAEADVAVENYNATLLRALREVADEASSLRTIEAHRLDVSALLPRLVHARPLEDVDDIAAVLHHRAQTAVSTLAKKTRARPPDLIAGLIPVVTGSMSGDMRTALDVRQQLIQQRAEELGRTALADGARWTRHLGRPPVDAHRRREWFGDLATVAAYRDRHAVTGDAPLGRRQYVEPTPGRSFAMAAMRRAHQTAIAEQYRPDDVGRRHQRTLEGPGRGI